MEFTPSNSMFAPNDINDTFHSTSIGTFNFYNEPIRVDVIEKNDSIEFIYLLYPNMIIFL